MLDEDINICRDPEDDLIIETAMKGKAQYIVSRDDDLKFAPEVSAALSISGIIVLSVAKFLSVIET